MTRHALCARRVAAAAGSVRACRRRSRVPVSPGAPPAALPLPEHPADAATGPEPAGVSRGSAGRSAAGRPERAALPARPGERPVAPCPGYVGQEAGSGVGSLE